MEPTQPPVIGGTATETPRAAVVEILERHRGAEKKPLHGADSILMPNMMRVNGVRLRATVDQPVFIHQIDIDGRCQRPQAVTLSLFARELRVGEQPTVVSAMALADDQVSAVIEIPDLGEPGEQTTIDRPYVYLNGHPIYLVGPITVHQMMTDGQYGDSGARVTLTIAARRVVIDDEPDQP